jgi:hypothetical protein
VLRTPAHLPQVHTELTCPTNMAYLSATQPMISKGPTAVLTLPAYTSGQVGALLQQQQATATGPCTAGQHDCCVEHST